MSDRYIAPDSIAHILGHFLHHPQGLSAYHLRTSHNAAQQCNVGTPALGKAGTVYLMYPQMSHPTSQNLLRKPRFIRNGQVRLKSPMRFDRSRSIWQASSNAYLLKILDSVFGAIFIMADRDKARRSRDVALDLQYHRDLIDLVLSGKIEQASEEMDRHLTRSLQNSLNTFQVPEPPTAPDK